MQRHWHANEDEFVYVLDGEVISRPAVSEKRLSLTLNGDVRYQLKTPYRDGTTHVIFEPLDFIARLAALAPKQQTYVCSQ